MPCPNTVLTCELVTIHNRHTAMLTVCLHNFFFFLPNNKFLIVTMCKCMPQIGFGTGTEKPAVFPKRVVRVRVRCWTLAYRGIPLPVPAVSRVCTGILQ